MTCQQNIFTANLTEHCLKTLSGRDVNLKIIEERSLIIKTRKTFGHKSVSGATTIF